LGSQVLHKQTGWRVFKEVNPDHHYVIGVDASGGKEEANYAAACVLDIEDHEQVAAFNDNVEPEGLAKEVSRCGGYYSEALVAVEGEKYGNICLAHMMESYPNLYYHTMKSTAFRPTGSTTFGWSPRYREEAVLLLQVDYSYNNDPSRRDMAIKINDKNTLTEMSHFIKHIKKNPDARVKVDKRADRSHTDDLVSALYIANYVWHEVKDWYVAPKEEETPEHKQRKKWRDMWEKAQYDNMESEFWTEDEDGMG
jgi:hypothetical protein